MDNPKALQHWAQDEDKQKTTTQRIKTRSSMDLTKIMKRRKYKDRQYNGRKNEEHVQANNGPLNHKPLHRKNYW